MALGSLDFSDFGFSSLIDFPTSSRSSSTLSALFLGFLLTFRKLGEGDSASFSDLTMLVRELRFVDARNLALD